MKNIQIQCPAKINLTLEIVNKRDDGFHNIKSIMQMINLYDVLDIKIDDGNGEILLSGNSTEIPYNEKNLVYKAAKLFYEHIDVSNTKTEIYIDKKIPIAAGLAGGSTDAAGTLLGLNTLFDNPLNKDKLHDLCSQLGSDLNVCLEGGCLLATSRGEKIKKIKSANYPVTLIKPMNLGISAKEAYTKYSEKKYKPQLNMTGKMIYALNNNENIVGFLHNDLEYAVFEDYKELQIIKKILPNAIMSGSGSTYFVLADIDLNLESYQVIRGLKFIQTGVSEVQDYYQKV